MTSWKRVFTTHEEKQITSCGDWPGDEYHGVALPCDHALWMWVEVVYLGRSIFAQVRDLGPFTTRDDAYVFGNARPLAEIMKGKLVDADPNKPGIQYPTVQGREIKESNGAGIDLMPGAARALGIPLNQNVTVCWRFIDQPPKATKAQV